MNRNRNLDKFLRENLLAVNGFWMDLITFYFGLLSFVPFWARPTLLRILGCRVGKKVFIDRHLFIKFPWKVSIGDGTKIHMGAKIFPGYGAGQVFIGQRVRLAPGVSIYSSGHDINNKDLILTNEVRLGEGCWIGANSTILAGVSVGKEATLGAGSVLTKDVPDEQVWAGIPARQISSEI